VKTSGTARTVAARGSHAPPPLAARGPTRRREIKPETGGPEMAFSPLLFLAGGDNHRYLQNGETHTNSS